MIQFFRSPDHRVFAVQFSGDPQEGSGDRLRWLFGQADLIGSNTVDGPFIGPRKEMITPWSTNAVEITINMGISGIERIEEFFPAESMDADHDPMLEVMYKTLDQDIFTIIHPPDPIRDIEDIAPTMKRKVWP